MRIDHIEIFVPSRREAASWYGDVLGFEIVRQHLDWAEDEGGPLMISNDGGDTMIALFRGPSQGEESVRGLRRLALREDADGFLRFIESSGAWSTPPLGPADAHDHGKAFSVYFADPWGNLLEVTTYDYDNVAKRLAASP